MKVSSKREFGSPGGKNKRESSGAKNPKRAKLRGRVGNKFVGSGRGYVGRHWFALVPLERVARRRREEEELVAVAVRPLDLAVFLELQLVPPLCGLDDDGRRRCVVVPLARGRAHRDAVLL